MSGLKAITSSGGAFAHDNNNNDDDDMKVPGNTNSLFFSSWMTKFGARTQRRGSLGFNDSHIGTPPSRLDDDSNSGFIEDKYQSGELEKNSISKSPRLPRKGIDSDLYGVIPRKQIDSHSEVYGITPGEDGDSYFLMNKYRQNDCDSTLQDTLKSSIHITRNGLVELDIAKPNKPEKCATITGLALPILDIALPIVDIEKSKKKIDDNEESIFLIDLEKVEESKNRTKILKPQTKKFSASTLLQNNLAQNWFFQKNDDDTSNLVKEEDGPPNKHTANETDSDRSMFYKLKTLVEKNHSNHREMNVWQPQGT